MVNFSHSSTPDIWRQAADAIHEWSLDLRARLASGRSAAGFPQLSEYGHVASTAEHPQRLSEGCELDHEEYRTGQAG